MTTPGRASFAGLASQAKQSPSFRDIARLIVPTDREKAFKQAMTNAIAILIVVVILVTLYAICIIMAPFIRPLLLALLFGAFLHPLKRKLSLLFKQITMELREAGFKVPFILADRSITKLISILHGYVRQIIIFGQVTAQGDLTPATVVLIAAISLAIIGGDALMNVVMCVNLIVLMADTKKTNVSLSDACLQFLIRSFILAQVYWLHEQIIYLLLPIVVICVAIRWSVKEIMLRISAGNDQDRALSDNEDDDLDQQAHGETPLRDLINKFSTFLIDQLDDYIDTLSSACVIGIVAFIVVLTALYLSLQIYSESVYLVEKVSTTANTILHSNPELKSFLPFGLASVHNIVDGAVKNTYHHGREWIKKSTRQMLNEASVDGFNSTQSNLLEKQMVEFWDRAYVLWLNNREIGPHGQLKGAHKPYDWERLFSAFQSLDFALCAQIFKQNWDTLMAVFESITKVLRGNLSLFFGLVTATLSLVVVGGNVIVNLLINLIIFTTALFYLLCASDEQYKPIELIKRVMPQAEPSPLRRSLDQKNRQEFLHSVDQSINAVFTASIKMMIFHGLSTWLLHRLFELDVVYIPSVISALFAAVPIVSPNWASVPACFGLWITGNLSHTILMLILATVPSSFVTTAFYSEIKGAGHPYLTGLAIAGGVFVFGMEGALFGPMLLVSIRLLYLTVVFFMDIYK